MKNKQAKPEVIVMPEPPRLTTAPPVPEVVLELRQAVADGSLPIQKLTTARIARVLGYKTADLRAEIIEHFGSEKAFYQQIYGTNA